VNTYKTSTGERLTKGQIDSRIRKAKAQKLDEQRKRQGYNACSDCGINSANARLDCSHDLSVKKCQEYGKTEKAYDLNNITIRCRDCHRKHDKNY
jgi:uncharacterized Rmd1/YagE family protein